MSWKFWKKEDPVRPRSLVDPELAACEGIRKVLSRNTLVPAWREYAKDIPPDLMMFAECGVLAYQLQVCCDLVSSKYGPIFADAVKGNVERLLRQTGVSFDNLFDAIVKARAMYVPGQIPEFSDVPEAERDLVIANTLFFVSDIAEDRKAPLWFSFARCLSVARAEANSFLTEWLNDLDIQQAPSDVLLWSPCPGCFERHLQRRYNSPLFEVGRRIVTRTELLDAHDADIRDAFKFSSEVHQLVRQVQLLVKSGNSPVGECAASWKAILELRERAAAIGGDWQVELCVLSTTGDALAQGIEQVTPSVREIADKYASLSALCQIPIWAQWQRPDTPIKDEERISSLLSEDLSMITAVSRWAGGLHWDLRDEVRSVVSRAVADGLPLHLAQERLSAALNGYEEGTRAAVPPATPPNEQSSPVYDPKKP